MLSQVSLSTADRVHRLGATFCLASDHGRGAAQTLHQEKGGEYITPVFEYKELKS